MITFVITMNIKADTPQIAALKEHIENTIEFPLNTHGDFLRLSAGIEFKLREHMSESTLERLWGYSTRGYETVSVRTLNVLCRFIGYRSWEEYCICLNSGSNDSELFTGITIDTESLAIGTRIRIGWQPDRLCIIRYLGDNRFIAEKTENSTMQKGDTFSCLQFQKGRELHLDDFRKADPEERYRYVVGMNNGLTTLEVLPQDSDGQ